MPNRRALCTPKRWLLSFMGKGKTVGRQLSRKAGRMTIMQLVSGVGTIAGIVNVILGIKDKSAWCIVAGMIFTAVELTYLVGTL